MEELLISWLLSRVSNFKDAPNKIKVEFVTLKSRNMLLHNERQASFGATRNMKRKKSLIGKD